MLDGITPSARFNFPALHSMGVTGQHARGWDGRGVVIGFADYGFDLLHPCS